MLSILPLTAIIYLVSYLSLKPSFASWSQRDPKNYSERFETFEGQWGKIFFGSWVLATITQISLWFITENQHVAFIVGTIFGLLAIAAWTDAHVKKVPLELTKWTVGVSFVIFFSYLITNSTELLPKLDNSFYPSFSWSTGVPFMGGALAAILIGFLLAVKTRGRLMLLLSLVIMFMGTYLLGYAVISSIRTSLMLNGADPYWITLFSVLLTTFVFLGVVVGYDLFLPRNGMGGADILVFYTLAFAFSWWVTPYLLFIALLVAFTLQLLLHAVARPLGIAQGKEMRNGVIRQIFVNSSAKRKGLEPTTTHIAYPVAFIPVLVIGTVGTIIFFIIQQYSNVTVLN